MKFIILTAMFLHPELYAGAKACSSEKSEEKFHGFGPELFSIIQQALWAKNAGEDTRLCRFDAKR